MKYESNVMNKKLESPELKNLLKERNKLKNLSSRLKSQKKKLISEGISEEKYNKMYKQAIEELKTIEELISTFEEKPIKKRPSSIKHYALIIVPIIIMITAIIARTYWIEEETPSSTKSVSIIEELDREIKLIVFSAEWAKSCPKAIDIVKEIAESSEFIDYRVIKYEEEPEEFENFGIDLNSLPITLIIVDGEIINVLDGAFKLDSRILEAIEKYIEEKESSTPLAPTTTPPPTTTPSPTEPKPKIDEEQSINLIIEKIRDPGRWLDFFSSCSLEKAQKYIAKYQFVPEDEELSKNELSIVVKAQIPEHITIQEAKEDVEYLFYLLSRGYSGYGYFKTEGDFDQAKNNIRGELETRSTLSSRDFSELIYKHLNFIHDGHFRVGYNMYYQHKDFWYDKTFEIWKTGEGYYFISDNKKWKILEINGKTPESYGFPSLNSKGKPIYRLGVLSQSDPEPLILKAKDDNNNGKTFEIPLYHSTSRSTGTFEESNISGVPIISVRTFSNSYIDQLEMFLQTAEKYRGESYLILDIRDNGGGSSEWGRRWIEKFTGYDPKWYFTTTAFFSKTTIMGHINSLKQSLENYPNNEIYKQHLESHEKQLDDFEKNNYTPYWSELCFPTNIQMIPNTTKLIVLIDGRIYSAGEKFIGYLRQVENVIFVGENSGGIGVFGENTLHQLPNSKFSVYLPSKLFFPADLKNVEEEGLSPDLWVPADDALSYVLEAIEKGMI